MARGRAHRRYYKRRQREVDLPILERAWRTYLTATRSIAMRAVFIERAYFRSQDFQTYISNAQRLVQERSAASRAWIAACRKVHRGVLLEPLGRILPAVGLPRCYLVRVPSPRSIVVDEHVFGAVAPDDTQGRERLLVMRARDRTDKAYLRQQLRLSRLYDKMVTALREHRRHQALKDRTLGERESIPRGTPAWYAHAQRSYKHDRERIRNWRVAKAYQQRLANLGMVYDFAAIETPLQIG